jgi:tRNA A37 threonylcarbamoyladenosine synthetase subunit TsaC/SUA5/YrdC
MTVIEARQRLTITDDDQVALVAEALAAGAVVAHAFGTCYVITTRAEPDTVRAVNLMKGRPPGQVGSITAPPAALSRAWDLRLLPDELPARTALTIVDTLFAMGPFGFRAPAAASVPDHLSELDGDIRTAQVIAPGYRCPSNALLAAARRATGDGLLYITSANRSRHLTGAEDSPAHWRADGLRAEFGDRPGFLIVEHPDEAAARLTYPRHLPMSTTILGLHRVVRLPGDPRPHLVLERHGSLPAELVRGVLTEFGYGLVLGPRATSRLLLRDYTERLSDR